MLGEVMDISISPKEPQQLIDHRLEVYLLGSEQREPLLEVVPKLIAKHTDGTCPSTVVLAMSVGKYVIEKVFVGLHY